MAGALGNAKHVRSPLFAARAAYWTAMLLMLTTAGCGKGTVTANGHVMIEGEPASGGRLSLSPVGGGPRAYSLVAEDGAFRLQSTGGTNGALPSSYRVSFQLPLDAQTKKRISRELAGEMADDELMMSYRGPRDEPFVIPDSGDEDLVIDIRKAQGWTRHVIE